MRNDYVVLVTGGRDYSDFEQFRKVLDKLHGRKPITLVVHGGCESGADSMAATWADEKGIQQAIFPVTSGQWDLIGKRAGPIRNQAMVHHILKINRAVHFPGGKGTKSCINAAKAKGIKTKRGG